MSKSTTSCRPTLSDVARIAGVSAMAVSSVLNGARSTTRVGASTRRRIEEASSLLGYRTPGHPRPRDPARTGVIGLYTGAGPLITDVPFAAMILAGLQKGCAEQGMSLMLQSRFASGERWGVTYPDQTEIPVDGAIILSKQGDPMVKRFLNGALPTVAMVNAINGIPSVVADEIQGARLLVQHLASRGHRRLLWRPSDDAPDESGCRRHAGLVAACDKAGLTLIDGDAGPDSRPFTDREKALIATDAPWRPTAVVCFADYVCEALVDDAMAMGLAVPRDLAVVGFDGISLTLQQRPRHILTTIRCPWATVAARSVDVLAQRLGGEAPRLQTVLPVELVCGSTT